MAFIIRHSLLLVLLGSSALASYVKLDFKLEPRSTSVLVERSKPLELPLPATTDKLAYNINFTVGTPPQKFSATFDTGSSDLIVSSTQSCKNSKKICELYGEFNANKSSTFKQILNSSLELNYGMGAAEAFLSEDTVSIGGVELKSQGLYVAAKFTGQAGEGILGIGYASGEAAAGAAAQLEYPSIIDNLYKSGAIKRRAFSLYLDDQVAGTGSVLFGGIDTAKYVGDLVSIDISPNSTGAYERYAVSVNAISLRTAKGSTLLSPPGMASRYTIDSGESQFQFPPAIAEEIWKGLGAVEAPGATLGAGLRYTDCAYRYSKAAFGFQLGGPTGPTIYMPVSGMISIPDKKPFKFGNGVEGCAVLLMAQDDATTNSLGTYILGNPFMRSAYLVYDQDNNQVSIAQAVYNSKKSKIVAIPGGSGLPGVSSTATGLATMFPAPPATSSAASASASASAGAGASSKASGSAKPPKSASMPAFSLGVPVPTGA